MDEREERALRLKRLKRKRMCTVVILCVLLVGLLGGYYAVTAHNKKVAAEQAKKDAQGEETVQETKFTSFMLTDVAEIEYSNEEAVYNFYWFEIENYGGWLRRGEEDFPTDDSKVQTIINYFCGMVGTSGMVAKDIKLSDYGLEDTDYWAKITLRDGTVHTFYLGDETPYSSGDYLLYENTGEVFVVASTVKKQLATKEIKLVLAETFRVRNRNP